MVYGCFSVHCVCTVCTWYMSTQYIIYLLAGVLCTHVRTCVPNVCVYVRVLRMNACAVCCV